MTLRLVGGALVLLVLLVNGLLLVRADRDRGGRLCRRWCHSGGTGFVGHRRGGTSTTSDGSRDGDCTDQCSSHSNSLSQSAPSAGTASRTRDQSRSLAIHSHIGRGFLTAGPCEPT